MIELHMGGGSETVDSLPGDIKAGLVISRQLLDLRTIGCKYLVAAHTLLDIGNSRHRPFVDADMTCRALDPVRYVSAMRKRDRFCGSVLLSSTFGPGSFDIGYFDFVFLECSGDADGLPGEGFRLLRVI